MLRIDHLHVLGFKSFCERTEVSFTGGITAIVGPNGCGKSNIGDAIHWVLGEQSSRTLRGERMEDVIFAGSDARKQLGMAEVRMKLSGPLGSLPGGRESVEIARRLYRSGESEYLIDNQKARLKDIADLLEQARIGARTYAVIEQGKVEQIITSRPKERRLLIEEAAGIAGYKQKKRLSELKLEATEANLLRVSDIVVEITRQIGSLKRQAARARRFARLRDELRGRQKRLFGFQAQRLDELIARVEKERAGAADLETSQSVTLARIEAGVEERRAALAGAEATASEQREELHRLDVAIERETQQRGAIGLRLSEIDARAVAVGAEIAAGEDRLRALRDEIQLSAAETESLREEHARIGARRAALEGACAAATARSSGLREAIETARGDVMRAREALVTMRNELIRLDEDMARSAARSERLSGDLEAARRALAGHDARAESIRRERAGADRDSALLADEIARVEMARCEAAGIVAAAETRAVRARADLAGAAERLRTLSDAATRFGGRNEGVRWVLTRGVQAGVRARGVVADFLRADLASERAAEGYLSDILPAVLVEEEQDLLRAVDLLRNEGAGRCLFLSERNGSVPAGTRAGMPAGLAGAPGVVGTLAGGLRVAGLPEGLITDRLHEAVIVADLPRALELHRRNPGIDFVTTDGEVVYASGLVAGGRSTEAGEGLLAQSREIEDARARLEVAGRTMETAREDLEAAQVAHAAIESTALELAGRRAEMEKSLVALRIGELRAAEEQDSACRTVSLLEQELDLTAGEASELLARRVAAQESGERLNLELVRNESLLAGSEIDEKGVREGLLLSGEELGGLRSEEAALGERRAGAGRAVAALEQRALELMAEVQGARASSETDEARRRELENDDHAGAGRLAEALSRRQGTATRLEAIDADAASAREGIGERDAEARQARGRLDEARTVRQAAEIESARAASDREHLARRSLEDLGEPIEELLAAWRRGEPVPMSSLAGAEDLAEDGDEAADPGVAVAASVPVAMPAESPFDVAAEEAAVASLRSKIEFLGPVNMMALEEFAGLEERHTFLTSQQADLRASIESLRDSIRKINRSSRERFVAAFDEVRGNFSEIFRLLFGGGHADLILEEDADALEAGLEIVAQPPGKRPQRISLLSGGEKALTAIALLFAIFRFRPSPFCLLDEVDAPLDEANVVRFTRMLQEYARETQFIVITHNRRSMEAADVLYGVTMPEPGISRVVSMRLPEPVAN